MQIKNKVKIIFILLFSFWISIINLKADEFNIEAKEIVIDKENSIIIGKGSVVIRDSLGKKIYADKATYKKDKEFVLAEGNVKIDDNKGNFLTADKVTYDKLNEKILTYNNSKVLLKEGYTLIGKNILYDSANKILSSEIDSVFTDLDGNIIETSMFQYDIENNLFSSLGKIKIIDVKNNKYFFKEVYIDTKNNEMIGSDISVVLDQESFGVSKKNDPRFVANSVLYLKDKTKLSKGVFTVCQKKEDKCPPWSIKAKKITHDRIKKNIYYENAVLKIYDIPIFYFPRFFHPDPSVKRQSGFLFPSFTRSTKVGGGFTVPYYWAISDDKDFTFSPKYYANENPLFLNEYRQAYENGFLTLDTGYTEGYRNTSEFKTAGSRNHLFANLDLNFDKDKSYDSNFTLEVQRTSNDTYFRNHNINTALVSSENTNLENNFH